MRLLLRTVVLAIVVTPSLAADSFRAAAVKIDITPDTSQPLVGYGPRNSEGVHDRLYHRVLVLDDGEATIILVSSDLGAVCPIVHKEFAEAIQEETGIDSGHFWWAVTHTHAAPAVGGLAIRSVIKKENRPQPKWDPEYKALVKSLLIQAAQRAIQELAPARIAVGKGMSLANMNRRAQDVDGKIGLGLNPNRPVDHQIGLIRLEHLDGTPIALIANYAMHGTALGAVKEISGDAQGIVATYVEEKIGAPMLYINGAAGNVTPIYFFNYHFRNLTRFNILLGDPILEANRSMKAKDATGMKLKVGRLLVDTPLREEMDWPEELSDFFRVSDSGERLVRLPVYFLKIGKNTVIWAAPIELFTQIAMRIRDRSPFPNTYYFGYTNGFMAYLGVREALAEGGYEPGVTPYAESAGEHLTQAVVTYLHGMSR